MFIILFVKTRKGALAFNALTGYKRYFAIAFPGIELGMITELDKTAACLRGLYRKIPVVSPALMQLRKRCFS